MYKSRTTTELITSNRTIVNDKFNSLYVKNIGTDKVRIFDNLLINAGEEFWYNNTPDVIMSDDIQITFAGGNVDKQLVVMRIYKEII